METHSAFVHHELIDRCRNGDRVAHFRIYTLYAKAMYNVGYRITGDEDEAQDVLQEAFISAFKNLESYRGDAPFGAWLKRIVINKAVTALQKRKFERIPEDEKWDIPEDEEPVIAYREGFTVERVKKAIEQLPAGYRTVLSLYLLEGYDHQEIGEIMGINESTSKSQLNRAKAKLRDALMMKEVKE